MITQNKKATGAGPAAFQTNKKPQAVRLWLILENNEPPHIVTLRT